MELFTRCRNYVSIALFLLLFVTSNRSYSQDLFGMLPSSPTSYVTSSTMSTTGDIYITIWGSGVFKSNNKAKSWTPINTGLTNLNITHIEFISSSEILISTMGAGVFKTTSITNVNWQPKNNGLTNLDVRSIKRYPNGMMMIGTYGNGVYISKDKGETWIESSKGLLYKDVTTIEIADNGWIVAGTYGGGVYQSRDTAKSWSRQNSGLKNLFINDIKRNANDLLYAATNGRGVYVSVNDGIVWSELDTFMTRPQRINPVPLPDLNATKITFTNQRSPIFGSRYGGIYVDDQIEDFTWVPTSVRGVGVSALSRAQDSIYGFTAITPPYITGGNAESWRNGSSEPFASLIQYMKVFSTGEKQIIAYKNNTVKVSVDEGKTWSIKASTPTNINKISRDSSGYFYAATESGLYVSDASLSDWNLSKCIDTMVYDVEISPLGTVYIATRFHLVREMQPEIDVRKVWSTKDGVTWKDAGINFDTKVPPPHDIGITYTGHVYVCAGKVMIFSKNDGNTWLTTTSFQRDISSVGFLRDNTVIIGTLGAGLYKSPDGVNYSNIASYPANSINAIHVGLDNTIYASGLNELIDASYGAMEMTYYSVDNGETFVNFNNSFNAEPVMSFTTNSKNDMYMSTVSGMIYRAVSPTNLTVPNLISQADKAVDVEPSSVFSWTSSERAELYQLEISFDDEFEYIWESVTQRDTVHLLHAELFPNHTFYWRVRSKNHQAVSDWSEVRTFSSRLETPLLNSPLDKSENIPVYANLVWHKVEGGEWFKIQLSKNKNFNEIEHEWQVSDTTSTTPLLNGKAIYYWRVMAMNELSTSNWSEVWSFETVFGPPNLIYPSNGAVGIIITPLLVWEEATEVEEYDIQISTDSEFNNIIFEDLAVSGTSVNSTELTYDANFYWRVRSRKGDVTSEWSIVFTFHTGYSPVVLISPANESVNIAIQPEYKWDAHPQQNTYEVEVAKKSDFSENVIFKTIESDFSFVSDSLDSYEFYYWRARVLSESNQGNWSVANKFKTKVAQVNLRLPSNKSVNQPISIRFQWYAVKGATRYHLQISKDEIFNDLIFSQDTISSLAHQFNELIPSTAYYWRVRGVSPEGVGDWSSVWTFNTGNNIPVLESPENGAEKVATPVTFRWGIVSGATSYQLDVSEQSDFKDNVISKSNINGLSYKAEELDYPKTYFWRIRATTNEGNSSWSQVWSFGTSDPNSVLDIIPLEQNAIYPNPAKDVVNIILPELMNSYVKVSISDMSGRKVFENDILHNNGLLVINCAQLPSGNYTVRIIDGVRIFSSELILTR